MYRPRPLQLASILVLTLALASPASAQFGALKKKLKAEAAAKAVSSVETAERPEPAAGNGGSRSVRWPMAV